MERLFKINVNERISLDDYFKYYFFHQNKLDFPNFNFICDKHSKNINNCCIDCKHNICKNCLEEHKNQWFK